MNNINEQLVHIATLTGRPWEEALTYHLLEGVLRRVSHSVYARDLVLRGGMLTRIWVTPGRRVAVDVDFLGLYPFDVENTRQRFQDILAIQNLTDGVVFDLNSLQAKGIWLDTEFPGARINIDAAIGESQRNIQIDVGFNDPLVPPAQWIDYPTLFGKEKVCLQTVRPETMVGWKLHGLIELGAKRWRPKDLYDLMLFGTEVVLDETQLLEAIAVAFSSRNASLQEVLDILAAPEWWNTSKNRSKWKWYIRKAPTQNMPEDFLTIVATVIERWRSVVESLSPLLITSPSLSRFISNDSNQI